MKADEIKLHFQKLNEQNFKLNIVSNLKTDLGKGDSFIVNGRKSLSTVIDGYSSAIPVYNSIISQADRYIDMAKALGEANIEKALNEIKKEASDMIKICNSAVTKLRAI